MTTYTIKDVQKRLNETGFPVGPVDGVRGKATIAAIRRFQLAHSLIADGIAGPLTLAAMFRVPQHTIEGPDQWPWLTELMRIYGYSEIENNAALKRWLASAGGYVGDPKRVPWCGDAVETAILRSLPWERVPRTPFFARSWINFGVASEPRVGAICVWPRGEASGHVAFLVGETKTHWIALGGNQGNRVSRSLIPKSRKMLACRWPSSVERSKASRAVLDDAGDVTISTNEE
jgi:uncharacterized protein (TIGR02594 family)